MTLRPVYVQLLAEHVINHWNSLADGVNFINFCLVLSVLLNVLNLLVLRTNFIFEVSFMYARCLCHMAAPSGTICHWWPYLQNSTDVTRPLRMFILVS